MRKKTNLEEVKKVALCLAYVEIGETAFSPVVVQHPILESAIVMLNGRDTLVNILEDKDGYAEYMKQLEKRISDCVNPYEVYCIFRSSYKLTFIRFAMDYLSVDDMSRLLADAWVVEENPNQDVNVSVAMVTRWFRKANKRLLMTEEDYAVYESLQPEIVVYRGVGVGRNPKGLSWTMSFENAKWFAGRFNNDIKKGYVQKATVRKENILAYFNTRNEDEIVANIKSMKNIEKISVF